MPRTIVECLWASAPCAECEERDCCRDERRVAHLRARVAELEADLADADEVRTRRCNELIRDSNDYARMMEQRVAAAESRVTDLETALATLLDAAERQAAGFPLDAEQWFAVRDYARARLPEKRADGAEEVERE